jgi:hypothetical protein
MAMGKEKVTMTLDAETLAALRRLVGPRGLSAAVNEAITDHIKKLAQFAKIDRALAQRNATYGPIPQEALDWAEKVWVDFEAETEGRRRAPAKKAVTASSRHSRRTSRRAAKREVSR